jgi:hypothetical protein
LRRAEGLRVPPPRQRRVRRGLSTQATHRGHVWTWDFIADVIALVEAAIAEHGAPEFIRSDNSSEFIAKDLQR